MPDRFAPRPFLGTGTLTIRPLQGRAGLMLAGEADITTRTRCAPGWPRCQPTAPATSTWT